MHTSDKHRTASRHNGPRVLLYRFVMLSRRYVSTLVAVAIAAGVVHARQADRAAQVQARIDRIFKAREFDPPRFGPARWMPGGAAYAIVERPASGKGSEIVRYDAATGARSVLVAADRLVPPGAAAPLDIDDYAWSADGKRLLLFTNTVKVWRQNTRGDYWVLDVGTGALRQLGAKAPKSSLMFAKFSPDGTRAAYVRGNNIYVEDLGRGTVTALTADGSETIVNGTSDWVYEEELGVRDGFRWSPDGSRIAYWQFDTSGVGIFTLIDDTSALYPTLTRIPYPKVGTTNSAVRVGVVAAAGGTTTWMKVEGDPREHYIARVDWLDAATLGIQQLNRLQNVNEFLLANAATGSVTRAFRDASKAWVDVEEVRWIDKGAAFLWLSERGLSIQPSSCTPPPMSTLNISTAGSSIPASFVTSGDGSVSGRSDLCDGSSTTSITGGRSNCDQV